MRRILKRMAWVVGSVLLLLVSIPIVFYFLLRSGELTQQALPYLSPYLKPVGIEITQLTSAKIDLMRSVELRDIAINWQDDEMGRVDLVLSESDLLFDMSGIMDQQFVVEKIHVKEMTLRANLTLPGSEATQQETEVAATAPLLLIQQLLDQPPVALLMMESLSVEQLNLDITLQQPGQILRYQGTLDKLIASLRWDADGMSGDMLVRLGDDDQSPLQLQQQSENGATVLSLIPALSLTAEWQIVKEGEAWHFSTDSDLATHLRQLSIEQQHDQQSMGISADSLAFKLNQKSSGILDERLNYVLTQSSELSPITLKQRDGEASAVELTLLPNIQLEAEGKINLETLQLENRLSAVLNLAQLQLRQDQAGVTTVIDAPLNRLQLRHHHHGSLESELDYQLRVDGEIEPVKLSQSGKGEVSLQRNLSFEPDFSFSSQGQIFPHEVTEKWQLQSSSQLTATLQSLLLKQQQDGIDFQLDGSNIGVDIAQQLSGSLGSKIEYATDLKTTITPLNLSQQGSGIEQSLTLQPNVVAKLTGEAARADESSWHFSSKLQGSAGLTDLTLDQVKGDQHLAVVSEHIALSFNHSNQGVSDQQLAFALSTDSDISTIKVSQQTTGDTTVTHSLHLNPELTMQGEGSITDLAKPFESLTLLFTPQLQLNNLQLTQSQNNEIKQYRIANPVIDAEIEMDKGQLQLDGKVGLNNILIADFAEPFSLNTHLRMSGDSELRHGNLAVSSNFNQLNLATLNAELNNSPSTLSVTHSLNVQLPDDLQQPWVGLPTIQTLLELAGCPSVAMTGKLKVDHDADSIQQADFSQLAHWTIQGEGGINLTQHLAPTDPAGVTLAQPINLDYRISNPDDIYVDIALDAPSVMMPPLQAPLPLTVKLNNRFDWPLSLASLKGEVGLDAQQALGYQVTISDQPQQLGLKGEIALHTTPTWQKYLAELEPLSLVGKLNTRLNIDAKLVHDRQQFIAQPTTPEWLLKQHGMLDFKATVDQFSGNRGSLLELNQPMSFRTKLDYSNRQAKLDATFALPELHLPKQLSVKGFSGGVTLNGQSADEQTFVTELSFNLNPAKIKLYSAATDEVVEPLSLGHLLTPLSLELGAAKQQQLIELESLKLAAGEQFFNLNVNAKGDLDNKSGQLNGLLNITFQHELADAAGISGQGAMAIPLTLHLIEGKQFSLEGAVRFDQLTLSTPQFTANGIDGELKFEQELLWEAESLSYRYLIPADPFQRVDYQRIQPYLADNSLNFESISIGELEMGLGSAGISLKQNLFRMQPFELTLLGGHVTGQFYLDSSPSGWKIGLLSRATQVDLRNMLKQGSDLNEAFTPISARTAIAFDINTRLMEGRIDVTEINRIQLLQLLEVVDPDYQDPQLATVRSALRLAHPEWITILMEEGLMELSVKVSALASPIRVRNLPLTPLINHFGEAGFAALEKIPLERN